MPKREPQKKQYPISISDWIAHLDSESSRTISYYVSIFTISFITTIIFTELAKASEGIARLGIILAYLILIISLGLYAWIIHKWYAQPYRDLSRKIIKEEITDLKKILKEFNKILGKQEATERKFLIKLRK